MTFKENYTTDELKAADTLLDSKEQTEQSKSIISNDTFALCEIGELINKKLSRIKL